MNDEDGKRPGASDWPDRRAFDGGKVTTDFNGDDDQAFALVLQGDGKLVAVGGAKAGRSSYSGTGEDFALARYLG